MPSPFMCRRALFPPLVDGLGVVLWGAAAMVLQTGWLQAAGPASAYDEAVAPLLTRFCSECHAGDTPEAGVRLDDRHPDLAKTTDRGLWLKVLRQIEGGVMPPEGGAMPSEEERKTLVAWIRDSALTPDCSLGERPGRVRQHRPRPVRHRCPGGRRLSQ